MNGNVTYNGSQLLSGAINVNTTGNIQALNVQVTENGERTITPTEGVDGYAPITIDTNVPTPEPVLDTLNVTSNGTYTPPSGIDGYDEVNVSVPTPEPVLDTLNVTSNGTYTPPSGVDGYDEVNVSVSGYTIKTLSTTPTSIATFTDGTSNPLKSLTASIVPVQAGSGDPSPTNVRPISGWTEEVITRTGKNFVNNNASNLEVGGIDGNAGWNVSSTTRVRNTIAYPFPLDDLIDNGYTWTIPSGFKMAIRCYDKDDNYITMSSSYIGFVSEIPPELRGKGVKYVRFVFAKTDDATITVDEVVNIGVQLELGSIATTYEPYAGTTYTIPFTDGQGQSVEVFGGSVDVVNGGGSAYKEYDSYNGETLVGPWISDRDVYVPNTSPTIGAQVVDMGDTSTFYTQPTSIKSLDGVNNVFASTGDVEELKYFTDL